MATTNKVLPIPPALAEISFGSTHILTKEFARYIRKEVQTVRKLLSQTGEAYGVRPHKIGNHWLWNVQDVAAMFPGAQA